MQIQLIAYRVSNSQAPSSPVSCHKHSLTLNPVPIGSQEVGPRRWRKEGMERKFAPWGRSPQVRFRISSGSLDIFVLTKPWQHIITITHQNHDKIQPIANYSTSKKAPLLTLESLSWAHFLNSKRRTFENLSSNHVLYLQVPPDHIQPWAEQMFMCPGGKQGQD